MQALGRRLRPEHRPFTHFMLEELEPRVLLSGDLAPLPMPAEAGVAIETVAITPSIRWNTDASGFWDDAANWLDTKTNLSRVPDASDDVLIDRGLADPTITIRTAGAAAANLLDSENLVVTGGGTLSMNGVLSSTGQVKLSGGILSGATIEAGTTVTLTQGAGGASNALDGITLDGTILTQASGSVTNGLKLDPGSLIQLGGRPGGIPFTGSLTLLGDQDIDGTGEIRFSDVFSTLSIAGAVTIAPGITIDGLTGQVSIGSIGGSLTNEGTIGPSVGGTLSVSSGSWTNAPSGVLRADGGSLTLGGTWSNQGEIAVGAKAGSALSLGGTFTTAGIGKLTRDGTVGNSIAIVGRMNNTGDTLTLNAGTGSWILTGHGILTGGTIATSADAPLVAQRDGSNSSGELDGVSLDGTLVSKAVFVTHGLTLAPGSMVLADGGVTFSGGDQTVGGTGTIRFNPGGLVLNGGTVTIGPGITIDGTSGSVTGGGGSQLINQGTISLSAGSDLNMTASSWVNAAGGLLIGDGSKLHLKGNWSNAGTIIVGPGTGSLLELGGTVKAADLGTIIRNDPTNTTVNVTGTIDIDGGTLALNTATGNWLMQGGTISGGTLATRDGVRVLSPITGSGRLNAITLDGTVSTESSSALFVTGGMTMMPGSLFEIGGSQTGTLISGQITLLGDQTIGGTGELRLSAEKSASQIVIQSGKATFGPGITVDGNNGAIFPQNFGTGATLTNEGTIGPDVGGTLSVSLPFTNAASGVLRADGGRLDLQGTWSNAGEIMVGAMADSVLRLGGTFTTAGLGHYTRAGGRIDLTGTLDNSNNTLSLNADTGSWNLIGFGRLLGGTLSTKDGTQLATAMDPGISNSVVLNNLTVAGTVAVSSGAALTVTGGLTFDNGLMLVGEPPTGTTHHDSSVTFVGSQTIGGTGEIRLFGPRSGPNIESALRFNLASGEAQGSVTIGSNVRLDGDTVDLVAASKMTLINQGTITTASGGSFISGPTGGYTFINQGSMIYANAGVAINGQLRLDDGSVLRDPGGEITFTGTLDNAGKTLTLDDSLGIFNLADNGTIKGGTIVTVGTNDLVVFHTTGVLDGVTLKGSVDLSFPRTNSIGVKILNGLTMDAGLIKMGVGAYLVAEGSQTLGGKGSVLFTDKNASNVIAPTAGSKLTIGPDITIHGTVGKVDATGGLIDNQGTIAADGDGTVTAIAASHFAGGTLAGGTWQALGTGTLRLSGAKIGTNAANLLLDGAGAKIIDDNSSTTTLAGLTANATGGAITLRNGAQLTPAGNFSNAGSLDIGADTSFTQASTSQFASAVIAFSSQFGTSNYSAAQVLGASNVTAYGDSTRAWAPLSKNGSTEFVTVGFATPVFADGATVRETLGNGFVTEIDVLDTSDVLHTVWTGTDPSVAGSASDFKVTWERTPYLVKGVKVLIDTNHSATTWEEIDSIQLHGLTTLGSYQQSVGVTKLEGGTLAFAGGVNLQGGVLGGAGTVAADLTNAALVDPGYPTGILTVARSYTQTADGHLKIDVGGTTVGTQYDRLAVTGNVMLDGTLDVGLVSGFGPAIGQTFDVITYAAASGAFAATSGTDPLFVVDQQATALALQAVSASPDLAFSTMNVVPISGTTGQDLTFSYTVDNLGNMTALGAWFDSIYLSTSPVFDTNAVLLARVEHKADAAAHGDYTQVVTASVPSLAAGNYRLHVLVDSRGMVADTDRSNNGGVSPANIAITVPVLTIGTPITGSIKNGQDILYRLVMPPGQDFNVAATLGSATIADLLVSYGKPPDPATFDTATIELTPSGPKASFLNAQGGDYYVLLHGRDAAGTGSSFTLEADAAVFEITSFTPDMGSSGGDTTVRLSGARFTKDTIVTLSNLSAVVTIADVTFVDSQHINATFHLGRDEVAEGFYNIRATDHGQTVTAAALFSVDKGFGFLSLTITSPGNVRVGNLVPVTIHVNNASGSDAIQPLVEVIASNVVDSQKNKQFFASPEKDPLPGIVPPGDFDIGIIYTPKPNTSGTELGFNLSVTNPSTTIIDWDSKKEAYRPPYVDHAAWDAVWDNFRPHMGSTQADFYGVLINDRAELAKIGDYTDDVHDLMRFEFARAANDTPAIPLMGAGDLTVARAGPPLFYNRIYSSSLYDRFRDGRLGIGWSDNYDVSTTIDATGLVTIRQGTIMRFFGKLPNGSYQGFPGETGTLTAVAGGGLLLRELNGSMTAFRSDGFLDYYEDNNHNRLTASYIGGLLTQVVHSDGGALTFTYNKDALLESAKDPLGHVVTYGYDAAHHLTSVTTAAGVTTYTWSADTTGPRANTITSITNPAGNHVFYEYDTQGRLTRQTGDDPSSSLTYLYGLTGYSVTDGHGSTTKAFFNHDGQHVLTVDPLGHVTQVAYDELGRPVITAQTDGGKTTSEYDNAGRLVAQVDALGERQSYTYDTTLNVLSSWTDARGNTTSYVRNAQGLPTSNVYADGTSSKFAYNSDGVLTQTENRAGQAISYTSDADGRLIRKTYPDSSHVDYAYDAHGNMTSATDATGTTTMEYDTVGHLTKVTYPSGQFLQYTYDASGRATRIVDQDGFAVNYEFDAAGRLARATDASNSLIVGNIYDQAGRLLRQDRGNGTTTLYEYDDAGQIAQIKHLAPDSSVQQQLDYTYDSLGRQDSVTTLEGKTVYTYDGVSRLTSVQLPDGHTISYQYDAAGNRLSVNDNGVISDYATNNVNEYTSVGGNPYTYDQNGNLLSGGGVSRTFDVEGRVIAVSGPDGDWTYQYDALGRRIAATHNGVTTRYLIDPSGLGNVFAEYDQSGALVAHYTQMGGLASRVDAAGNAAYYGFDASGNTRLMTSGGGTVLNQYSYLPFGESTGATEAVANPFTFSGQFGVSREGGGSYFMRARSYDPQLGRFVRPDPLGASGGTNVYTYAANNPLSFADPTGLVIVFPPAFGATLLMLPAGPVAAVSPLATTGIVPSIVSPLASTFGAGTSAVVVPAEAAAIAAPAEALAATVPGAALAATVPGEALAATVLPAEALGGVTSGLGACMNGSVNFAQFAEVVEAARAAQAAAEAAAAAPAVAEVGAGVAVGVGIASWMLAGWYLTSQLNAGIWGLFHNGHLPPCLADNNSTLGRTLNFISACDIAPLDGTPSGDSSTRLVGPVDPNELFGPGGFGTEQFIDPDRLFPYGVYFENDPKALAPAQNVVVTEQLDADLDWSTFQLGDLGWGDIIVDVPEGRQVYSTRVDARDTLGLFVDVTAGLDTTTGIVTWTFTSLDPATLDTPADPFAGFLPPDTDGHKGQGFATYFISPKSDLPTGTVIGAEASIVFDTEAAMSTLPWSNTMDAAGPSSSIAALPAITTTTGIDLDWSGTDDAGGSGIASYDVLVSDNGAAYTAFLTATTLTSATFTGQSGHTYSFYMIATDNVGHVEAAPAAADATTRVQLVGDVLSSDTVPGVVKDADGTTLDVVLTGPGHWQVVQGTTGPQLRVTGTSSDSAIVLKTSGGDGRFLLTGIDIAGPAQSLIGTAIDLNGPFALHGPIASLVFGDIAAAGSATVGDGSRFDTARFISGESAPMNLTIQGGGRMITTPLPEGPGAAALVGDTSDASGSHVTVNGANSLWQVNGQLVVGNAGHGSLSITDGGAVVAASLDAASAASGNGVISVVGADSRLSTTGSIVLGNASAADLWVLNGAVVTAANAVLGLLDGSSGVLDIEGAGSRVDIAGDLTIGGSGTAVLVLGAGTELNVGGNLIIGPGGVLDSFGGVIGSPTVSLPALSVALANDTGTSASDNTMTEPTMSGQATATNGTATLRAGLGAAPESGYLDLTDAISTGGSFSVSPAPLAALNGAAQAPGDYTQNFVLTDKLGLTKQSNLSFTLLTSAPPPASFSIAEPVGIVGPVPREMSVRPARYVADPPLPAHISLDPGDWTMDIGQFDPFDWLSGKFRGHRPLGVAWTLSLGRGIGLHARVP